MNILMNFRRLGINTLMSSERTTRGSEIIKTTQDTKIEFNNEKIY